MSSIENISSSDSLEKSTYLWETKWLKSETITQVWDFLSDLNEKNDQIYAFNLQVTQELISNECLKNTESNDFCIQMLNDSLVKQNKQLS